MTEPVGNSNEKKRAPLRNSDLPPRSSAPGKYFVYLTPGYTLEDHKRTVGADALPIDSIEQVGNLVVERATANHIASALSEDSIEQVVNQDTVYYVAQLSQSSLDAVRLDPSVWLVECSVVGYVDDD